MMRFTQSMVSRQCYGRDVKYWLSATKYFWRGSISAEGWIFSGWSDQPIYEAGLFISAAKGCRKFCAMRIPQEKTMLRATHNRKEMIAKLLEHAVSTALVEPQQIWMREVFEKGFVGYGRFTDAQLRLEMQLHGLDGSAEIMDESLDDEFQFSLAHI
jgi:hypothetical protein